MLRLGVIGFGSMGKNHARVCAELENVKLIGIADSNKPPSGAIVKQLDTTAFRDYREMLPHVDAMIIATPTDTHYRIALDLLRNGKHVLVEKPICDKAKNAVELVKVAEQEDVVLAVGHIERHNPTVMFIKDALVRKRFGSLISIAAKRVSNFPERIRDVGVIFDFGIHDIDVMRFLVGEVKSVYAKAGRFTQHVNHEDYACIVLNFENGICGVVEVNWLTPMKIRKLFLTCSQNFIEADYVNQSVTVSSSSFNAINEMDLYHTAIQYNTNEIALVKREPLRNEIVDFIEAVEQHKKPLASGEDGLIALKIAEAARISYQKGKEVVVS